jgi:hypothetical protein
MATTITITGSVTLDESLGLQNTGTAVTGEDNNDSDVSLATLQGGAATFYNRLFNSVATGGLGLSTTFATNNGVAESASNFITVSGGTVTSLGFLDGNGGTLPVYSGDPSAGVATSLSAVDGGAIRLFADATLGNHMVLGVDTTGNIVFAIFMDPNATLTSARVWMVQFEAISNLNTNNPDDSVNLFDSIGVAASSFTEFNFNALPSGQNLFGTVGDTNNAIVVIGRDVVLKADGTYANNSNTINTSQGGGAVTIGVNNQMFDAGEGAYFTYVKSPKPDFLSGAPNGLDQNEADQAADIQYTGGTLEVDGGFAKISQIQGGGLATMRITAYNITDSPQGTAFVNGLGTGTLVAISSVKVFDASGNDVTGNKVSITGGIATISGLDAGYKIQWTTGALHDRVLIEDVAGKFDIGAFGVNQPSATAVDIGQQLTFEDDGPKITATATGAPSLTVDETVLATNDTKAFAAQFTPVFGTDGQGATPVSYALSTPGGASGLTDTATGESVVLSLNASGQVVGQTATTGQTVFVVGVDASGNVTLDQQRAIVHTNPDNPDESRGLIGTNLVVLTATAFDKDGDHAAAALDLTPQLVFKDDGPSITATATGAPTLTVDETVLATNDTKAFAGQFSPTFGADGQGAIAVSYALSTPGGASGLTDTATGEAVVLSLVNGQVLGKTATTGTTVFVVSVDASGNVTLDQQRAIVHANPNDPDESRGLTGSNLVVLTATATDKDADHASAPLDLTSLLVFKDDPPSIGHASNGAQVIDNSIVDFAKDATATKSLEGVVGADPNAAPYNIDSFTSSITINGTELHGVASNNNQTITYYADTNGDTIFGDTGDTAFYQLSLNETGAGSYAFTVLVNPPPAELNFNFNALPSGQNLFGTVGDTSNAIVVIGEHPVLKADGTYANSSDTINTSQGGGPTTIGVNNQMFDAGEGAYFTYVKSPNTDFLAGFVPNGLDQNEADDADNIQYTGGTLTATQAFAQISQIQGNSLATMKITAFDIGDSPQGTGFVSGANGLGTGTHVDITSVHVFNATGTDVSSGKVSISGGVATVSGLSAGFKIEWATSAVHDRALIEDVAGKFDIGGFGITQTQATPDQKLDFVARATDGDGDFKTASFSIGIDGTGINHDGHVVGVG